MNKHPLLIENERVEYLLEKVVGAFTWNEALREDLMQEARIHLWRLQSERPGQTLSWYLRGCRFRLQHYLAAGRSLDSGKRRGGQLQLPEEDRDSCECLVEFQAEDHTFDEACLRDLIATLALTLQPREREVLHCLADGLPTALIARRLKLSAPTVLKYRRKIAHVAVKFGINAPQDNQRNWRLRASLRTSSGRRGTLKKIKVKQTFPSFNVVGLPFGEAHLLLHKPLTSPELAVVPAA